MVKTCIKRGCYSLLFFLILLVGKTVWDIHTPVLSTHAALSDSGRFEVLDRSGQPLGISYQNRFNSMDNLPLHKIPEILWRAFITSEDRHFFEHHGVDWKARCSALWQNIRARRAVRGASTITEQVVRIIQPRPRTLWSRWIEGFEAMLLEMHASKGEILEFYLNQVPYASNRRGIVEASRYYFNRTPDTLTHKEMLTLAILPRAPSVFDLYKNPETINKAVSRLAMIMAEKGEISADEKTQLLAENIVLQPSLPPVNATHFINYIRETIPYTLSDNGVLMTTLDSNMQRKAQNFLDERLKTLARKRVHNGAVLIVDHTTGEILAWVVGSNSYEKTPGEGIDAVRTPRQPGSSMKPFLYALALDSGWSPATELDDAPMTEAIGSGLHDFHNYSHTFYGKISLREALGNSLNIPALETIDFIGPARYLDTLHALGFSSLTQPAHFYNEGLALGNGEVSLFEMVQAYSALANRGVFRPLTPLVQAPFARENKRIYSEEAASLIANILSDPYARRREFGSGSVLNLPVQTAVKTGTSTDYHDAWVMGFNARYMVGIWLGNLDQSPMDGVTGSTGPALIMRSIFADLSNHGNIHRLYLSPKLAQKEICSNNEQDTKKEDCFPHTEYFISGTEPKPEEVAPEQNDITIIRPTENLQLAYDPRIPSSSQEFEFAADGIGKNHQVAWQLNDKLVSTTKGGHYLWPVARGHYSLVAEEIDQEGKIVSSDIVHFNVK